MNPWQFWDAMYWPNRLHIEHPFISTCFALLVFRPLCHVEGIILLLNLGLGVLKRAYRIGPFAHFLWRVHSVKLILSMWFLKGYSTMLHHFWGIHLWLIYFKVYIFFINKGIALIHKLSARLDRVWSSSFGKLFIVSLL